MLITVVGEATYSLMCDLCSPVDPEKKTFDELVSLVSEHLEPKRSEIAERHVFRLRRQRPGEPLMDDLQSLKHLASTCNFKTNLEENLRDQFVSGLVSEAMRSRIFAETTIKYKEAVELALALEAAEKHAEVSGSVAAATTSGGGGGGGEAGEGLHQASARRGGGGSGGVSRPRWPGRAAPGGGDGGGGGPRAQAAMQCWRCGKPHRPDRCKFVHYNCDQCNQRGHLKVMCKQVNNSDNRWAGRHHFVNEESDEDMFNIAVVAQAE
ncbi:uncharacterized protein LOC119694195 [Plutella xylostella]|uniref:uncharacterized protein LOC119694195 n=1 Tax=Plutella xylostella TaxID=51655 RepID=UPI002032F42F|nr:uncharacterized protein LOC119694195 [Plutella xylostella]